MLGGNWYPRYNATDIPVFHKRYSLQFCMMILFVSTKICCFTVMLVFLTGIYRKCKKNCAKTIPGFLLKVQKKNFRWN